MRVRVAQARKQNFWDRAPLNASISYAAAAVAPHATTTRATYTVPAARLALVQSAWIDIDRNTAAAPIGVVEAKCTVNAVVVAQQESLSNTAGVDVNQAAPVGVVALAGQVVTLTSADGGTGGSNDYHLTAAIAEFDA